mmetsp:Transcript_63416/g.181996  ORF Transcript_63416/g.181996 Transcript_63416/m.181996 type:complete len:171 (+) Transcript_63416:12-524(+)
MQVRSGVAMGQNTSCCSESCGGDSKSANDFGNVFVMDDVDDVEPVFEGRAHAHNWSTPAVPLSAEAFSVTLQKLPGQKLGLDVEHTDNAQTLPIIGIRGGSAQKWNDSSASSVALRPGDEVVEVNGVKGSAVKMLEKCQREDVLVLKVVRGLRDNCQEPCHQKACSGCAQ